jgi:hypothetical protein
MLRQILDNLKLPTTVDITKIPASNNNLAIIPDITIPLYGELLVGEKALLKKVNEAVTPFLVKLNKLLTLIGSPKMSDIGDLISQLQLGAVVVTKYKEVEVDYEELGYQELKDLADKAGVSVFSSVSPIIDGEISTSLLDLFKQYLDSWFNNCIPGETALDIANSVLLKKTVLVPDVVETIEVNAAEVLAKSSLSWDDLYTLQETSSIYFTSLLLIYFRTGIIDFNPLEFLTLSEAESIVGKLTKEMQGESEPIEEQVLANANIEKQPQAGGSTDPLDSEPTIPTKRTVKRKVSS